MQRCNAGSARKGEMRMRVRVCTWALLFLAAAALGFAGDARAATFTCSGLDCPIAIVDNPGFPTTVEFPALPYPSTIAVGGLTGSITKGTPTLPGYSHPYPHA